jgi:hypothetical protein
VFSRASGLAADLTVVGRLDATTCPGGIGGREYKVVVSDGAECYGVLTAAGGPAEDVVLNSQVFTYPDRVELVDVAYAAAVVGGRGALAMFLTAEGRVDVWDMAKGGRFWRSFTRCREEDGMAVDWRSIAVYKEHLYVLGLKNMRPLLKRLHLNAISPSV